MDYAEAYDGYAAQGILRMDVEIVKKSHFWMGTSSFAFVSHDQGAATCHHNCRNRLRLYLEFPWGFRTAHVPNIVDTGFPMHLLGSCIRHVHPNPYYT